MATERIIRYVDLTQHQRDRLPIGISIEDGHPVEPKRIESPTWLAISYVIHELHGERYILYFLTAEGRFIDFAQRRSLEAAMDEVGAVVQHRDWRECSLAIGKDWERIPREAIG